MERQNVPLLTNTMEEMVPAINHDQATKGKNGLGLEGARREVALRKSKSVSLGLF